MQIFIPPDISEALKIAREMYGSKAAFASALGIKSRSAINNWEDRGTPRKMCMKVERITKGAITKHMLRPDLFKAPVEGGGEV